MYCSIDRSWFCRKVFKKFGTVWDKISITIITVTYFLHLIFILQGGLDGPRIGGYIHLLVVSG
jgi:hypothetical protein